MVLLADMERNGATHYGMNYEIIHKGAVFGTVEFRKIT
jgi:hypothetical protein